MLTRIIAHQICVALLTVNIKVLIFPLLCHVPCLTASSTSIALCSPTSLCSPLFLHTAATTPSYLILDPCPPPNLIVIFLLLCPLIFGCFPPFSSPKYVLPLPLLMLFLYPFLSVIDCCVFLVPLIVVDIIFIAITITIVVISLQGVQWFCVTHLAFVVILIPLDISGCLLFLVLFALLWKY